MKTRKCKGGNKYYCKNGTRPYTSWIPPFKKKCKGEDALVKPVVNYTINLGKNRMKQLLYIVLSSTHEDELLNSMNEIYEIATGNLINETITFEDSRYLLTTRELQKIKETHYGKSTWSAVKKYYNYLFVDLYKDLNPSLEVISNGSMEDGYKLIKQS